MAQFVADPGSSNKTRPLASIAEGGLLRGNFLGVLLKTGWTTEIPLHP